ncbi:MAG: HYR domain-containing protein, partial [Hyphomicrobiaceae bacterium]|nr:HYR domain-containing protein [Hyphomicrobiaceae bacterium]
DGRKEAYRQVVTARDVDPPWFTETPSDYAVGKTGKRTAVHFEIPAARDAVDLDVDVSSSPEPGSRFRTGNTTVLFTATDASGNSAVHEMVVTVDRRVWNLVLDASHDRIRATWDPLYKNPPYRASISVPGGDILESTRTSGTSHVFSRLEAATEYVVTVAAAGDATTASHVVARTTERGDRSATMPPDIVREASAPLTPVHLGGVIIPDWWDPAPSISNDAPAAFPVGSTNVTWTVTDGETTIVGKQLVTITDTTKPVFSELPGSFTHVVESKFGGEVPFKLPTATDAADPNVAVSSSHEPGSKFDVGNTTVTFTASDIRGNTAQKDIVITVVHESTFEAIYDDFSDLDDW